MSDYLEKRRRKLRKNYSVKPSQATVQSNVVELKPLVLEQLATAYKDLQTSLNNLDAALMEVRDAQFNHLSPSRTESPHLQQMYQSPAEVKISSKRPDGSQASFPVIDQCQHLSLSQLLTNLKYLESRKLRIAQRYRKLFARLGLNHQFVDALEGVVSISGGDADAETE